MKIYPDRIPQWLSDRFSSYTWHGNRTEKKIYLTFDDGPTPVVTDYVLDLLNKFHFKATFFCIGDCFFKNPHLFHRIIAEGHSVGNHTHNHLNAWKVSYQRYIDNVSQANLHNPSTLFRPPYGRITPKITKKLNKLGYTIVLWDVLSGDFDPNRDASDILQNLTKNTRNGSIIVFHDSEKCYQKLKEILPVYFNYLQAQGFTSSTLPIV